MLNLNLCLERTPGVISFDIKASAYEDSKPLGLLKAAYPLEVKYKAVNCHSSLVSEGIPEWRDDAGTILTSPGIEWHDDAGYLPWAALLIIENKDLIISVRSSWESKKSKTSISTAGDLIVFNGHCPHRLTPITGRQYNTHKRLTAISLGFEIRPSIEAIHNSREDMSPALNTIGIYYSLNKKPR